MEEAIDLYYNIIYSINRTKDKMEPWDIIIRKGIELCVRTKC